ncbi:MAG: sodium:proton antiporter, partial [Candidatus Omnitrophica bacterium]|nr:sodium:proton antiporter [Candidatus Omnitrophota bacterium]
FCVGLWALLVNKNLIKKIIGLSILEYAVNLFFILIGYRNNADAPIFDKNNLNLFSVDPLPQALILTSIVIGLAMTAFLVALAIRIYQKYQTFDITMINQLKG